MDLDNIKYITKLDKENMRDLLIAFPRQCEDALFIGEHTSTKNSYKRKYANILFTGLGGSAIGADVIKNCIAGEAGIPIFVNRDYTLPGFVGEDTLVFAVSYSGNTEETLAAYAEARRRGSKIVVITSGGKLKERAMKNNDLLAVIPKGYPPRSALGYSFIPAMVVLSKLGVIKNKREDIKNAIELLSAMQHKKLGPHVEEKANLAKTIARKVFKRFPVVYASNACASAATRWRGQFAENAKALSSTHVFPEMNHNEIVGWMNPRYLLLGFLVIVLRDKDDHPRIKRRMNITSRILKKEKFEVLEIYSQGKTFLERILSLVYIGDFVSFYLSILNRLDPTPVDRITYLKKELAK